MITFGCQCVPQRGRMPLHYWVRPGQRAPCKLDKLSEEFLLLPKVNEEYVVVLPRRVEQRSNVFKAANDLISVARSVKLEDGKSFAQQLRVELSSIDHVTEKLNDVLLLLFGPAIQNETKADIRCEDPNKAGHGACAN
jgi:hypothetical protein